MALSLNCTCGYRFEVEETFAGQAVRCPECQQEVAVPASARQPLRTSGLAIASVVLALTLAFSGLGTILAILFGVAALVQIARHRDRVTGTGYAVFGIGCGVVFTGLFALALLRPEVFGLGLMRESLMGSKVDRSGPLDIERPEQGFAIRRPTTSWGVATKEYAQELVTDSDLVLVNVARDTYIDVSRDTYFGTLDSYRELVLDNFREARNRPGPRKGSLVPYGLTVRNKRNLPGTAEWEGVEVQFEVRVGGHPLTYLVRVIRAVGGQRLYIVRAWAQQRRFAQIDTEVRTILDSFRLVNP